MKSWVDTGVLTPQTTIQPQNQNTDNNLYLNCCLLPNPVPHFPLPKESTMANVEFTIHSLVLFFFGCAAVKALSLNHWTAREFPTVLFVLNHCLGFLKNELY